MSQGKGNGKKAPNNRGHSGITAIDYQKMVEAWYETQSLDACAKAANTTWRTARRYVFGKAAPEKGMDPIADRWARAMRSAALRTDRSYEQAMSEWQKILGRIKGNVAKAILAGGLDSDRLSKMSPLALMKLASTLLRDESFSLGGPDSRSGDTVDLDSLTDDQLQRIANGESLAKVLGT